MRDFKDFLMKIQTLDIQFKQVATDVNILQQPVNYYDISHEIPFLKGSYKSQLKELQELAITDILNLPREQILN
jgi:hypothetical protein